MLAAAAPITLARIGEYKVVKWPSHDESGFGQSLAIRDSHDRTVFKLHAEGRLGFLDDLFDETVYKRRDVNHDGVPEVIFESWSGGAYASFAYTIWSLGKRPRCLLYYDKGCNCDEHDFDLVDLDGDGIPEVRSWYDGFAHILGGTAWTDLPIVLKLVKGRYVERTQAFPHLLAQAERNEWRELSKCDPKSAPTSWASSNGAGINLVALGDIRGQRPAMWRKLRRKMTARNFRWLKSKESAIVAIIRGRSHRYSYPLPYQAKALDSGRSFPPESLTRQFED